MKIIYFTTACEKDYYNSFICSWDASLNTSIQSLHNRLIRSLALTHEVEVFSARPFSRKYCNLKMLQAANEQEGKINWHYLEIKRNKLFRDSSTKSQIKKMLSKMNLKDCIILTDTLNPLLLKCSTSFAKTYGLPIIGVCNYTPSGIRDTGVSYTRYLHSLADDLSGYITLTSGLNELFNKQNRANLTIEGVLENKFRNIDVKEYGNYIYYYGDLEEKYGVYDLINAFTSFNREDLNLVIAGYHANEEKINKAVNGHTNIKYLGKISSDLALSLANGSVLNVNPRPYSEDFDRYLIPNIVLDYLNSSALTLSVRNSKLQKNFSDDAIWINSSEKEDIIAGFVQALDMNKDSKEAIIKKANADVNKLYSMSVINHKVILFLKQFLKQRD